jgi:hypothetical protein
MKKKLLAHLALTTLTLGVATTANAIAPIDGCTDPLTSTSATSRFCVASFNPVAPAEYRVSFEYMAEKFAGITDQTMTFVYAFGNPGHVIMSGTLSDSTATPGWNTFSFVAQAADDVALVFALRGSPGANFGLGLQNIQITSLTTPVPEPATLAMLMAGLGAIVFVGRRRRL